MSDDFRFSFHIASRGLNVFCVRNFFFASDLTECRSTPEVVAVLLVLHCFDTGTGFLYVPSVLLKPNQLPTFLQQLEFGMPKWS